MTRSRLLLLAAAVFTAQMMSAATNDFFTQGLDEYRNGDFPAATVLFERSATNRPSTGALINLGIVQWQRGHAGAAILAWERARWIAPFNHAANENLAFARSVAQVGEPRLKWYEILSAWLPPNLWVWLAGLSLWLAVGALTLPSLFRRQKSDRQQVLAALGAGAFLICLTANVGVVSRTQLGIVLKKDAPLLLTPTSAGEIITTLAAGEPARCLRAHGNYRLIQTPDGTGWIEQDQFSLIVPKS